MGSPLLPRVPAHPRWAPSSSRETDPKTLFRTAHPLPIWGGPGTGAPRVLEKRLQGWEDEGGPRAKPGEAEGEEAEQRDYLGNRVGVRVGGGGNREKLLARGGNGFRGRSWKRTKFLGSCPSPSIQSSSRLQAGAD